ncbi:MAG TPA: hypothetical protein VMH20_04535 [Verrucomicrobiae bacterium]|nr:hypothetical protein [Verrucomicrobiae bacterium]
MKARGGLALLVLGLAIYGAWSWWLKTRNFVPVDVAIVSPETPNVIAQFRLNFDGLYFVEIMAQKSIPLETLHCLMGVEADATRCQDLAPAIDASWSVASNGREIAHGSSNELHSLRPQSGTVTRVIGDFAGRAGREYELKVTFAKDLGALADARPRFKVAVADIAYTDLQSAGVLVFSITFICELFGAVLLVVSWYGKRVKVPRDASHNAP